MRRVRQANMCNYFQRLSYNFVYTWRPDEHIFLIIDEDHTPAPAAVAQQALFEPQEELPFEFIGIFSPCPLMDGWMGYSYLQL